MFGLRRWSTSTSSASSREWQGHTRPAKKTKVANSRDERQAVVSLLQVELLTHPKIFLRGEGVEDLVYRTVVWVHVSSWERKRFSNLAMLEPFPDQPGITVAFHCLVPGFARGFELLWFRDASHLDAYLTQKPFSLAKPEEEDNTMGTAEPDLASDSDTSVEDEEEGRARLEPMRRRQMHWEFPGWRHFSEWSGDLLSRQSPTKLLISLPWREQTGSLKRWPEGTCWSLFLCRSSSSNPFCLSFMDKGNHALPLPPLKVGEFSMNSTHKAVHLCISALKNSDFRIDLLGTGQSSIINSKGAVPFALELGGNRNRKPAAGSTFRWRVRRSHGRACATEGCPYECCKATARFCCKTCERRSRQGEAARMTSHLKICKRLPLGHF